MPKNRHLLVVDDEADFCDFVAKVAVDLDFQVTKVSDSRDFQDTYLRVQPDTVMLDIVMPYQDGIEIVDWMAGQQRPSRVIAVTGHNPLYARSAGLILNAKGISDVCHLRKPVALQALRDALR